MSENRICSYQQPLLKDFIVTHAFIDIFQGHYNLYHPKWGFKPQRTSCELDSPHGLEVSSSGSLYAEGFGLALVVGTNRGLAVVPH